MLELHMPSRSKHRPPNLRITIPPSASPPLPAYTDTTNQTANHRRRPSSPFRLISSTTKQVLHRISPSTVPDKSFDFSSKSLKRSTFFNSASPVRHNELPPPTAVTPVLMIMDFPFQSSRTSMSPPCSLDPSYPRHLFERCWSDSDHHPWPIPLLPPQCLPPPLGGFDRFWSEAKNLLRSEPHLPRPPQGGVTRPGMISDPDPARTAHNLVREERRIDNYRMTRNQSQMDYKKDCRTGKDKPVEVNHERYTKFHQPLEPPEKSAMTRKKHRRSDSWHSLGLAKWGAQSINTLLLSSCLGVEGMIEEEPVQRKVNATEVRQFCQDKVQLHPPAEPGTHNRNHDSRESTRLRFPAHRFVPDPVRAVVTRVETNRPYICLRSTQPDGLLTTSTSVPLISPILRTRPLTPPVSDPGSEAGSSFGAIKIYQLDGTPRSRISVRHDFQQVIPQQQIGSAPILSMGHEKMPMNRKPKNLIELKQYSDIIRNSVFYPVVPIMDALEPVSRRYAQVDLGLEDLRFARQLLLCRIHLSHAYLQLKALSAGKQHLYIQSAYTLTILNQVQVLPMSNSSRNVLDSAKSKVPALIPGDILPPQVFETANREMEQWWSLHVQALNQQRLTATNRWTSLCRLHARLIELVTPAQLDQVLYDEQVWVDCLQSHEVEMKIGCWVQRFIPPTPVNSDWVETETQKLECQGVVPGNTYKRSHARLEDRKKELALFEKRAFEKRRARRDGDKVVDATDSPLDKFITSSWWNDFGLAPGQEPCYRSRRHTFREQSLPMSPPSPPTRQLSALSREAVQPPTASAGQYRPDTPTRSRSRTAPTATASPRALTPITKMPWPCAGAVPPEYQSTFAPSPSRLGYRLTEAVECQMGVVSASVSCTSLSSFERVSKPVHHNGSMTGAQIGSERAICEVAISSTADVASTATACAALLNTSHTALDLSARRPFQLNEEEEVDLARQMQLTEIDQDRLLQLERQHWRNEVAARRDKRLGSAGSMQLLNGALRRLALGNSRE